MATTSNLDFQIEDGIAPSKSGKLPMFGNSQPNAKVIQAKQPWSWLQPRGFVQYAGILLALCMSAMALPDAGEVSLWLDSSSRLSIEGSSNVNKFMCLCNEQFPRMHIRYDRAEGNTAFRFSNATLHVRAKSLDCGNQAMNKDMYETLLADKHPNIRIELQRVQLPAPEALSRINEWTLLKANAQLTIAGITQPVVFEVQAMRLATDRIRLTSVKEVRMTDFGMAPPRVLMGLVKVHDTIRIHLDLFVVMVANS